MSELSTEEFVMVPVSELVPIPDHWAAWGDNPQCFVCGRKVGKKPAAWVHIVGCDLILPAKYNSEITNWDCDSGHEDGDGDMGGWPIGPECAKKARAEGLVK